MKLLPLAVLAAISAAFAQNTTPAFEAASIRPHTAPLSTIGGLKISGTLITMEGYNLPLLIQLAWNVPNYQLSLDAIPRTEGLYAYFDLVLRAPGERQPSREELRPMLQTLLAERFQVKVHRDTKEIPVYALLIAKNGPKLTEAAPDAECKSVFGPRNPTDRNYDYKITGCSIDRLVSGLGNSVSSDRPVIDKTGLTGKYDISLTATPDFRLRQSSDPGDISALDAVQKLGLKLEPQKLPLEMVVVDHAEKPSEN